MPRLLGLELVHAAKQGYRFMWSFPKILTNDQQASHKDLISRLLGVRGLVRIRIGWRVGVFVVLDPVPRFDQNFAYCPYHKNATYEELRAFSWTGG